MEIDPALVAVAGALSTVAGLLYRQLLQRADVAEKDRDFWRDKALENIGLAAIATDVAEKRSSNP
jgi:hypothetical protein